MSWLGFVEMTGCAVGQGALKRGCGNKEFDNKGCEDKDYIPGSRKQKKRKKVRAQTSENKGRVQLLVAICATRRETAGLLEQAMLNNGDCEDINRIVKVKRTYMYMHVCI